MPSVSISKDSQMYSLARRYDGLMDTVDGWLRRVSLVLLGLLVAVVVLNVVMRYVFSESLLWANELSRYLTIWFALLMSAALINTDDHLNVGIIYDRLSTSMQYRIQVSMTTLYAVLGLVWVYFGVGYALEAGFRATAPALNFQLVWVYSVLPISGIFVTLFAFARLLRVVVLGESGTHEIVYEATGQEEFSDA